MAIYLKKDLNVKRKLEGEVNFIPKITNAKIHVKLGILNLMPTLEDTESDLLKVLDSPILEVEIDFIYLNSKNSDVEKTKYFKKYYRSFKEIENEDYDGMIITGAPLEHVPYNNVTYIEELKAFFKYTKNHVKSTIFLCWASQFGLQYFYGVNRRQLPAKVSGLYEHYVVNATPLVKGFDDLFFIPQSRYCTIIEEDVLKRNDLILTSKSDASGIYIVESKDKKRVFLTGHAEYNLWTLDNEYKRDINKGLDILPPVNYYQNNDPKLLPIYKWHASSFLLYHNWLHYYVYSK